MIDSERKATISKVAIRIMRTMEALTGYSKQVYVEKLVGMLDDTHLAALDFAIELTPEQLQQPTKEK